ncbi:MAG: hypothetical protein ACRDOU_17440 [Streptosporangiaceae bacterium]
MRVILLGPQRRPTLDAAVRLLSADGPIATITAGWQEREPDDQLLSTLLGGHDVNLGLYRRWLDVVDRDPSYAEGSRRLASVLGELEDTYLLRLDYALQAVYALLHRLPDDAVADEAVADAIAAVRELDEGYLHQVNSARGEFFAELAPHDRPVIAEHRTAVAGVLGSASALVMAGGHVGVLAEVLHLFNIAADLKPPLSQVIAWSAGAMALADRIVLFHDRSPQGPGHPEVYGAGLSLLREVVLLPHAKARLLLDDAPRMAVFARRFAPARCILLETGTRLDVGSDGTWPLGTRVLAEDGHVTTLEAA